MSNFVDSAAHFTNRCTEIGVSPRISHALTTAGLVSLGKLAFSFGSAGQDLNETAFQEWVRNNLLDGANIAELSASKRLFFEAHTAVLHQMKESLETPGDSSLPKKIPAAEREVRLQRMRTQLVGLEISGPLDPAFALLDHASEMKEKKLLKYLPPEQCNVLAVIMRSLTKSHPNRSISALTNW